MKKLPWVLIIGGGIIAYYFYRKKQAELTLLQQSAAVNTNQFQLMAPLTPAPSPIESLILADVPQVSVAKKLFKDPVSGQSIWVS